MTREHHHWLHHRQALMSRLSVELRRSRRSAAIVAGGLVLMVASGVWLGARMNVSWPWEHPYLVRVAVDDADHVAPGKQEVRWAGIVVGRITGVRLAQGHAVITAEIDRGKGGPLYRDAQVRLRPATALNDMYLDIEHRGHPSAGVLRGAGVLAAGHTQAPVDIADVMNVFSTDVRARLQQALTELARGLPDGGTQLRSAFAAAVPWLRAQARLARVVAQRRGITRRLVHNLRVLNDELARRDRAITTLVRTGGATFGEIGDRRAAVDRFVRGLPATMAQMDGSFARLRVTLGDVRPALAALRPAARAMPHGLDDLRRLGQAGLPALRRLTPLAGELVPTSNALRSGFDHLSADLPHLDSATRTIPPCATWVQKFFAYTLDVFKMGNAHDRTASPRALLTNNAGDFTTQAPDPMLHRIPGCADKVGKPTYVP